jgi:hypothetical protein
MTDHANPDRTEIACNYLEGTSKCSAGAIAYVVRTGEFLSGGRIEIQARSRSGRWINTVENIRRLHNFRLKTIPPEHPRYGKTHSGNAPEDMLARIEGWLRDEEVRKAQRAVGIA